MAADAVSLSNAVKKVLGNVGKDRDFVADHGMLAVKKNGVHGISVTVRLTSYRSLPLSCIEGMMLTIDGQVVDMSTVIFTLNQYDHKLTDLKSASTLWWFILDLATVFIPMPVPLQPGMHLMEGTLVTVEPYITAGRFSFYNSSARPLRLDGPEREEVLA